MTPSPPLACRACGHETEYFGVQYCDRCFGPLDLVTTPARPERAPARWPERPVAAPGRAVTIDPSLAALRDAVEQEPFS